MGNRLTLQERQKTVFLMLHLQEYYYYLVEQSYNLLFVLEKVKQMLFLKIYSLSLL